ncbi:MAG: DUF4870 domain-containing protein [Betaproteobacteria bacterium]|nr:DUF4870 domain-containing protein [Betaproteobacteria bacterium]
MSESDSKNTNNIAQDDLNVAMLAHLLGILTGLLGSLIIWLIHKDKPEKAFVNKQAKEALNFQITVLLAFIVSSMLTFIVIGFLLIFVVVIANIIFCVVAGLAARDGKDYCYPFALRLIK